MSEHANKALIKVLSIDGGGIRGIIPVLILAYIEEITGMPIASLFDLIVGTSTGGIIVLGLTKPNYKNEPQYSAIDLIQFYEIEGKKIFKPSILRKFFPLPIFSQKFSSTNIELVLEQYFGNSMLSEATNDILITSFDVETFSPYFFKRQEALQNPRKNDYLMRDIARATSAAPTFFQPYQLKSQHPGEPFKVLIDGGVVANNPALCGYVEAKRLYPDAEEFLVVSVGTGNISRRVPFTAIRQAGIVNWSRHILDIVFNGTNDITHDQLESILCSNGNRNYYRFQANLSDKYDAIDDARPENLQILKVIAQNMIAENQKDLLELCKKLRS